MPVFAGEYRCSDTPRPWLVYLINGKTVARQTTCRTWKCANCKPGRSSLAVDAFLKRVPADARLWACLVPPDRYKGIKRRREKTKTGMATFVLRNSSLMVFAGADLFTGKRYTADPMHAAELGLAEVFDAVRDPDAPIVEGPHWAGPWRISDPKEPAGVDTRIVLSGPDEVRRFCDLAGCTAAELVSGALTAQQGWDAIAAYGQPPNTTFQPPTSRKGAESAGN